MPPGAIRTSGAIHKETGRNVMSQYDAFNRILASLYEAMLDDAHWPATSALIDDAFRATGNGLIVGEGSGDDVRIFFAGIYLRGQRRQDLERQYFHLYYPLDERLPRLRQLPDSRLAHVTDLFTDAELKTSPVYNEWLQRCGARNGLNTRLDGPGGSRIIWTLGDPIEGSGWGSAQIDMIQGLLPHIRQFVRVRQALASAEVLGASLAELLDNTRLGVIHLDRRGRIVEANDQARDILRQDDGLFDRDGFLRAWLADDNVDLERLLGRALAAFGGQVPASGSMAVRRSPGLPPLTLHITPVGVHQTDFGRQRVAALVLVVDPASRPRIDAGLVAAALGLTPSESQVASMLAAGVSVRDIATATGRQENTVYKHLKQMYRKLGISRQADLVRLVLSRAAF